MFLDSLASFLRIETTNKVYRCDETQLLSKISIAMLFFVQNALDWSQASHYRLVPILQRIETKRGIGSHLPNDVSFFKNIISCICDSPFIIKWIFELLSLTLDFSHSFMLPGWFFFLKRGRTHSIPTVEHLRLLCVFNFASFILKRKVFPCRYLSEMFLFAKWFHKFAWVNNREREKFTKNQGTFLVSFKRKEHEKAQKTKQVKQSNTKVSSYLTNFTEQTSVKILLVERSEENWFSNIQMSSVLRRKLK